MKKILLISGSARNGHCKTILESIKTTFWLTYSVELTFIRDFDIEPYNTNYSDNAMLVSNDKFDILLDKVIDADIVVLATPNYFCNMSGLTKTFVDRTFSCQDTQTLAGKKFVYIYVGTDTENNTKTFLDNATYGFSSLHNLNVLGSFAYRTDDETFVDIATADETTKYIVELINQNLSD